MQNLWQLTSILLGLLWLTLGSTANAVQTPTLALDHATAHIRLSAEQILTCETLRSIDQPSPFTVEPCQLTAPNTHANAYPMYHPPSPKAPHNVVWIAFTLHNTTDQALEIWLTTGHPLIEHIRVWQSHRPEPYDIGSQTPIQLKPIRHHEPIVPILLPAQAQITLMIGYASSTYINTQIDLWQPSAYLKEAQQNAFSHTLIFGALSLTSLLSLLAYLGLRHRFYAFLTLTLITETLLLIGQSGKLPAFYPAVALSGYTPTLWIIGGIHLVSYALFVHYFLRHLHVNFQQSNHHTEWFIRLFIVIFVVEGIALILLFIGSPYIDHPIDIGAVSLLLSLPLILFSSRLQNKLLEQKIKQQTQENEATAKFLREVNHEIRAPLNRVLTQALDIERPSLREKIIQNCRHVLLTIDEALSYSNTLRPIATVDQTVLTSQAFLDLLAQSGQEIVERTYREHHNSFIFNAQVSLYPWIMIDERRVMQIFDNLITNAARYTRKGKVQLTLTTKPSIPAFQSALPSAPTSDESTILTVIIQDTGMGISQEDQLRIFEPFVRGGAGMRSGCHGSGMGLAIVKQLVEQLEGSIKLKSEEGKGTQLTVTLPIYPASAELYQEHQSTHSTHFTRPNAETIKHLTTLIQQGGISDIIRWANQLSNEHPDLARFAQEITQSAVKGDMTRLRQLARPAETSVPAD